MDLVKKAMIFAYERHKTQKRKNIDVPYFVHLMDVASILYKNGADESLVCAGFLHDVVEDKKHTNTTEEELKKEFGKKITELVMAVTEKDKSKTWFERKKESIDHLKTASQEVKLLKCADKLSNIRDIYSDIKKTNEEKAFSIFNAGKKEQEFYYKGVLEELREISDLDMYKEYKELIENIFC